MHILFLSRWFPFPPNNGSKLRIYNLLSALVDEHDVTLISFFEPADSIPDVDDQNGLSTQTIRVPWKPFNSKSIRSKIGFIGSTPRSVIDTFSSEMAANIQTAITRKDIQFVIASQIDMACYRRYFSGLPALFEEVEVGVLYDQWKTARSNKDRIRYGLTWAKYRAFLSNLIDEYQVCTAASDHESRLIQDAIRSDTRIEILPNAVDLTRYRTVINHKKPDTIIFTGSFSYNPNYQAMIWFSREVFNLIRKEIPESELTITGDNMGLELPVIEGVRFTGMVDKVQPLIAEAACTIVPIHTGGGTRLKILESMALRTPVVTTSKGAQGLEVEHGKHLLIADDPASFSTQVIRLLRDDLYGQYLADNAYNLIVERYDWDKVKLQFHEIINRAVNN